MSCELPPVLLLDLDDTIVSFTSGKPSHWPDAFEREGGGLDLSVDQFIAGIRAVRGPYWSDEERAARGRQDLIKARRELVRWALDHLGIDHHPQFDAIADCFTHLKEDAVMPLEGAVDVLVELKERDIRLGLISNGSSEFQRRKLERYQLEPFFETILIEGEWGIGKPDSTIFEEALRRFGITADETWMVGDNPHADVGGAQAVGIHGVWVRNRDDVDPGAVVPDRTIGHIRELL